LTGASYDWVPSFLLGAAFVIFVAGARLRGNGADRSFTTYTRYLVAVGCYAVWHFALYFFLMCVVWFLDDNFSSPLWTKLTDHPAWVALASIAVFVYLPYLSGLDRSLRRQARRIGGMPDELYKLRDAIAAAPRNISKEMFKELHYRLLRRGIDLGNQRSVPDQSLHSMFVQVAEFKCIVENCERDRRFSGFMHDNAEALHALARGFDHVIFRSSRSSETMSRLHELANANTGRSGSWESLGAMVENQTYSESVNNLDPVIATSKMLIADRRADMRGFVECAATLLARLALASRRTEIGRVKLLRGIGVKVIPAKRPKFQALFAVFGVVFLAMVGTIGALAALGIVTFDSLSAMWMVPLYFVFGVACAVYPKQYFSFANVDVYGRQPWAFYLCAGLSGAALSFTAGLIHKLIKQKDVMLALKDAVERSPWLLITFTLAVTVAVLIQDRFDAQGHRKAPGRLFDAGIVAAALAVAMIATQFLFSLLRENYDPRLWTVALMVGIGAFIGFYIPNRFRTEICERRPMPSAPASTVTVVPVI
jgi:hypothetical protein